MIIHISCGVNNIELPLAQCQEAMLSDILKDRYGTRNFKLISEKETANALIKAGAWDTLRAMEAEIDAYTAEQDATAASEVARLNRLGIPVSSGYIRLAV